MFGVVFVFDGEVMFMGGGEMLRIFYVWLEVFLSDPDVVNKDVLKSKGGAAAKSAVATKLLALASARGVALSLHNCQTLLLEICVAEQAFLVNQNAGHAVKGIFGAPGFQIQPPMFCPIHQVLKSFLDPLHKENYLPFYAYLSQIL